VISPKLFILSTLALVLVAGLLWASSNNAGTVSSVPSVVGAGDQQSLPSHVNSSVERTPVIPGKSRFGVRTPAIPSGPPAIQPREELLGLGPFVPTFTEQDVRDFINRTGASALVRGTDPKNPPTITSVQFKTAREYGDSHGGTDFGQPDDTILCVVELAGSFTLYNPHSGDETCAGPAYVIFNGHTGNLLGHGVACNK
jgi:hypothetical protein